MQSVNVACLLISDTVSFLTPIPPLVIRAEPILKHRPGQYKFLMVEFIYSDSASFTTSLVSSVLDYVYVSDLSVKQALLTVEGLQI